jgi:hypothetical protein
MVQKTEKNAVISYLGSHEKKVFLGKNVHQINAMKMLVSAKILSEIIFRSKNFPPKIFGAKLRIISRDFGYGAIHTPKSQKFV